MMFNSQEGVQRGVTGEWVFATFWENSVSLCQRVWLPHRNVIPLLCPLKVNGLAGLDHKGAFCPPLNDLFVSNIATKCF